VNGSLRSNGLQSGEYEKTAAVMKLVIEGNAGAGTISMGGFDYHDGTRATGELRDFRAGECIGACLEYAARSQKRVMIYVFSDGSLSSNGMIDNSADGKGKGQWTGDNQGTAASFILVYNPGQTKAAIAPGRQLGWFRANGDVETIGSPAANSVNNLVELVALNYLALHNEQNLMAGLFPGSVFVGFSQLSTTPQTPPPPPPPGQITTCNTTDISANHGHMFSVTPAQLSTTNPVVLPVTVGGTDNHTHTVTLTVQQMDMLRAGQTVVAMSSSDGMTPHTHNVTVTCV
jgi:hypothetical protein